MSSWKAIERAVSVLVNGKRTWNSDEDVDVVTDGFAIECKHLKAPTVAECELYLLHNRPKAAKMGLHSALVVKRKAGRGRPSPFLAIFELTEGEADA